MKEKNKEHKENLEELLIRLREEKNLSRVEVLSLLKDKTLTEKDIKKWEVGLKYPDLDTMYELSDIYQVSVDDLLKARSVGCEEQGIISPRMIKWICYFLNVSMRIAAVLTVLIYIFAIFFAFFVLKIGLLSTKEKIVP